MATPQRGMRDIPTISTRGKHAAQPYKTYMQLSVIEMERGRKEQERRNAVALIAAIDARLIQLDAQEVTLLATLGKQAMTEEPSVFEELPFDVTEAVVSDAQDDKGESGNLKSKIGRVLFRYGSSKHG